MTPSDLPVRASCDLEPDAHLHTFLVRAEGSGQNVMRVLGLFAQQDMVPDHCCMTRYDAHSMTYSIKQPGMSDRRAHLLVEKLRQIVGVEEADMLPQATSDDVAERNRCC